MELPTQMPMVSSILPFMAIQTAVTCSAALAFKAIRAFKSPGNVLQDSGSTHNEGEKNETNERLRNLISLRSFLD
jgi:hypothetical protein